MAVVIFIGIVFIIAMVGVSLDATREYGKGNKGK